MTKRSEDTETLKKENERQHKENNTLTPAQTSSRKNEGVIPISQSLPYPNNSEAENEPQTQQSIEKVENKENTENSNNKEFEIIFNDLLNQIQEKEKNEENEIKEKKDEFIKESSSKNSEFEKILGEKDDEYDALLNEKDSETQALLDIFQNLQNEFDSALN